MHEEYISVDPNDERSIEQALESSHPAVAASARLALTGADQKIIEWAGAELSRPEVPAIAVIEALITLNAVILTQLIWHTNPERDPSDPDDVFERVVRKKVRDVVRITEQKVVLHLAETKGAHFLRSGLTELSEATLSNIAELKHLARDLADGGDFAQLQRHARTLVAAIDGRLQ